MNSEFEVLKNIDNNKNITQRDIANKTGMSLGNVNILIKRLIKKGLLKIEKINPKTIKYILTAEGIKEKAELTYNYILYSYRYINELNIKMDRIFNELNFKSGNKVVLIGKNDEICEVLKIKLRERNIDYEYKDCVKTVVNQVTQDKIILVWHTENSNELTIKGIKHINLLEAV